jgi:glycosyltransferase involved in cell wall biosynthesis
MRLLFVTQVMDETDAVLGAYHGWVAALAQKYDHIDVVCLYEGPHHLPENVKVHSLGKEQGARSAAQYALSFLKLVWKLRRSYDAVFVHMNEEYLLLAGWLWKLWRKPVYLWRNHYAGTWRTDLAASFCTKIFCTSKHSYTAKFKQTVFMPVGIDLKRFHPGISAARKPRSVLFLARMAPSKNPEVLVDALSQLRTREIPYRASLYGDPIPENAAYYANLKNLVQEQGLAPNVLFEKGIPNTETPAVYGAHDVFVNTSRNGMFDKTIFEAAGCGCLVLAASEDWRALAGDRFWYSDSTDLAHKLEELLALSADDRERASERLQALARAEGLSTLIDRLVAECAI